MLFQQKVSEEEKHYILTKIAYGLKISFGVKQIKPTRLALDQVLGRLKLNKYKYIIYEMSFVCVSIHAGRRGKQVHEFDPDLSADCEFNFIKS